MKRALLVCSLLLLVAPLATHAQQDPFLGTWKTNIAKSKYDPGPPPKTPTTVKIEATADGGVKTTVDGVDAQGRPTHEEYTAKYDGKDYPIKGSPNWDTVALRRSGNVRITIQKKAGNIARIIRGVLSPDGKVRTNAQITINPDGSSSHNVVVFEKQ